MAVLVISLCTLQSLKNIRHFGVLWYQWLVPVFLIQFHYSHTKCLLHPLHSQSSGFQCRDRTLHNSNYLQMKKNQEFLKSPPVSGKVLIYNTIK